MLRALSAVATRLRVLASRLLVRLGLREDSFLIVLAILIGVVTAAAAVGFHELINSVRDHLYLGAGPQVLYGSGIVLLVVFPAAGGLIVGLFSRYLSRTREGHGVIDVMESVVRTGGIIRPTVAAEKIVTSAVTIGTGGSCGAEGPIVQIGAALASGVGQLFRVARHHMPVLIGCGSAAGISAIFNAPIGGVLFTLEVILFDFSIRTFTPVVLASVIANITTQRIFRLLPGHQRYEAIFAIPDWAISQQADLSWAAMPGFALLGLLCGAVGVSLTRLMYLAEERFARVRVPGALRPALGGAVLGAAGVVYVMVFGWWLRGAPKPIDFTAYPMPAFFGDGYGVIRQLLGADFYTQESLGYLLGLLAFLCLAKLVGTCLTLGSGGSGGIIAPSLFLGATAGGLLGLFLRQYPAFAHVQPGLFALVGMGAVLAAVVHAPLASILILVELTHDYKLILPAMLATVIATGLARLILPDSIYTLSLRLRGVRVGTHSDLTLLRRLSVEQVDLEPACVVRADDPLQHVLELSRDTGAANFVVIDKNGAYGGMVVDDDVKTALLQREAVPLLLVHELARTNVPTVRSSDDLASVLDTFARHNLDHLPVCIDDRRSKRVIGLISRAALMRRYQKSLSET